MSSIRTVLCVLLITFTSSSAIALPLPDRTSYDTKSGLVHRAQIQLGLPDGMILSVMIRQGFSDIKITKRKLTKAQAEGCRRGTRYKVEINLEGRVKKEVPIGKCRGTINEKRARNILQKRGYSNIHLRSEGERFSAVACRQGKRFRIIITPYGQISHEKQVGPCHNRMNEYEVAAMLRARGFSRVNVTRGGRGRFAAEACRGDNKVGLVIDRSGAIVRRQDIGRCDPPIHPASIPLLLGRYDIHRVEVVDRRLPRYVAHGCRGTTQLEISLNRFGEIMDERKIGRCDPPLTDDALSQKLQEAGYRSVRVLETRANGFTAEVCEDGQLLQLDLTIYGETIRQRPVGQCPSRPVEDIVQDFEREGLNNAQIYVEGCRRGRRVRVLLDRTGNELDRQVVGRCR